MSVAVIVDRVIGFYLILIVVYVLMSWFRPRGFLFEVFHVVGTVVEPYISLFRRFIPPVGQVDFSPVAAILVLQILRGPIVRLVFNLTT